MCLRHTERCRCRACRCRATTAETDEDARFHSQREDAPLAVEQPRDETKRHEHVLR